MNETEMREFAEQWVEIWNSTDEAQIRGLYAEDVVLYQAAVKKTLTGIDHIIARTKDFTSMSSDSVMTARNIYVDGDTLILEVNVVGTHDGKFLDYDPTGGKIDIDTCLVFEMKDNVIAKHTTYLDTATVLRQLALIIVPGTRAEAA